MLCCIGIVVGALLAGVTGQIYLLPASVGAGAVGDFFLFRKLNKSKHSTKTDIKNSKSVIDYLGCCNTKLWSGKKNQDNEVKNNEFKTEISQKSSTKRSFH